MRTLLRTPALPRSLFLIAALALPPSIPAHAAGSAPTVITLVASIDGREHDRFAVEDETLKILDTAGQPVAGRRTWRIDGDARAAADYLGFVTSYSIRRRNPLLGPVDPDRPFVAVLFLDASAAGATWADESMRNGLVVFAWVVDGAIARVAPVPLARSASDWLRAGTIIDLTVAEARGAPVVLLWRGSGFVPVSVKYDSSLHAALVAMHFKNGSEAREAIMQIPEHHLRRHAAWGSLMHAAAEGGFLDTMRALRERGLPADLNNRDTRPIQLAAANGRADVVAEIVSLAGADNGSPPKAIEPAIRSAARNGHLDIAADLIARFNAWKKWPLASDALADGAALHGRVDLLRRLIENGKSSSLRTVSARALRACVQAHDRTSLALLLEHGADARIDHHGSTPLHVAAREGLRDIAALLVARKADVDATDSLGQTPLMLAARNGHLDTCRLLLEHRAQVARTDHEGLTALHFAIMGCGHEIAAEIVRRNARLLDHSLRGSTPLDFALALRSEGCARLFAEASAPFTTTDPASIEGAVVLDRVELLDRAARAGWDPALPAAPGWNWASVAAYARATKTLPWLAARGTAPDPGHALDSSTVDTEPALPWVTSGFATGLLQRATPITARVRLIAESDGRLLFPTIVCEAPEVAPAIMTTLTTAPIALPGNGGKRSSGPVDFLFHIPAVERRVYTTDEVDQPPEALDGGSLLAGFNHRLETTRETVSVGQVGPFQSSTYTITDSHVAPADGVLQEAWVAVVVEPDGSIGPFEALRNDTSLDAEALVKDLHVRPGLRNGTPVRVRLIVRIASSRT